ncbi:MAG TPA: (2Fe-2S)-binding protein, partial [Pseudomonas sp.]|nr:(2Fe-2S)-binding protein [Pseudomonas sp.]
MSETSTAAGGISACSITLQLNGQRREVEVYPWTTLLDLLREQLHLT